MSPFLEAADVLRLPLASEGRKGLRDAQVKGAYLIVGHFWASSRPALAVMPTGSGKTAVILLTSILLRARRVLVITPSRMLREQVASKFRAFDPLIALGALSEAAPLPSVYELDNRPLQESDWTDLAQHHVIVATPHAVSPKLKGVVPPPKDFFDVLIFDEGHHAPAPIYRAIADALPQAKTVLFTATPYRRDEQPIHGDLVFTYELGQARRDGVFGSLRYAPVHTLDLTKGDEAIARAVEAQFKRDRAAGLRHSIMVRTLGRTRAGELEKIYKDVTGLTLARVDSAQSAARIKEVIEKLKEGSIDGVIAVDMLGEGFDFPQLKIAGLHAPHSSLAVTLQQFIGRFARTSEGGLGTATFFAIPAEIEGEASRLYRPGAEWNELVEDLSRERIELERETREVVASFESVSDEVLGVASETEARALLHALRPYFHTKVYDVLGSVDLGADLGIPDSFDTVLHHHSEKHNAVIWIGRTATPARWSTAEQVATVSHELLVVAHVPEHRLLFVTTTRKSITDYDMVVEAVAGEDVRRLAANEIMRVLHDLTEAEFFSVGMRNRTGFGGVGAESYKMISGRAASRAIRAADGAHYDQGHVYGHGREGGQWVTIGCSTSSKVWSNRREALPELFKWFRVLAGKLRDVRAVQTQSGLDHLGVPVRIETFDEPIIAVELPHEAYRKEGLQLRFKVGDVEHSAWLVDVAPRIEAQDDHSVTFVLTAGTEELRYRYRLDQRPPLVAADVQAEGASIVGNSDRSAESALAFFTEHPLPCYTRSLGRIDGDFLAKARTSASAFAHAEQIDPVDWHTLGVDPELEKPNGMKGKRSIFEYVVDRLRAEGVSVLFADDGSNEIADFVAVRVAGALSHVELYHCKAAGSADVPTDSVADVYEVVGQAVKCRRWLDPSLLLARVKKRVAGAKNSKFEVGDLPTLATLLANSSKVVFHVVIVQPAIRHVPKDTIADILGAADAYLRGGNEQPLRVWGTKG